MSTISKFVKMATMILKDSSDQSKQVYNASRKAINVLTQEIAGLNSAIIDADIEVEMKEEALTNAKFSIAWLEAPQKQLQAIDNAKDALIDAEEALQSIKDTLAERQQLLDEYQKEVEA
jgi:chromosome segregation ATPase